MICSRAAPRPSLPGTRTGLVTLDLAEADDAHRKGMRRQVGEPYRTLLGHLRHEVGHFSWTVLAPTDADNAAARLWFGDERADDGAALRRHYETGPPAGWPDRCVSAHATMHPFED